MTDNTQNAAGPGKPKVLGVIPARLGSTRIPEKMLKDIAGQPLIAWTIERTKQAQSLDALVVSTDSKQIAAIARSLGVPVFMTPAELPTGTDRVAATVAQFTDFVPDIVANIWGDEPLYPAAAIDETVNLLLADEKLLVACAVDRLADPKLIAEPSIVKVLTDLENNVLCFTRSAVPYPHNPAAAAEVYHVIGVMAMRRDFLKTFLALPQTPIEKMEGVEQMRILEHGHRLKVVKGDFHNLGVNTPDELEQVRAILIARQTAKEV